VSNVISQARDKFCFGVAPVAKRFLSADFQRPRSPRIFVFEHTKIGCVICGRFHPEGHASARPGWCAVKPDNGTCGSNSLRADRTERLALLKESDRHRVAIEFSIARPDGGNDGEDNIQDPKDGQKNEADKDQAKEDGGNVVDEHRDLEVERFFAVGIDLGRVATLGQPDDERAEQVAGEVKKDAEQGAGVTIGVPSAHVGEGGGAERRW